MKDSKYVNIHSVNPLYLIIGEVHGLIEEKMATNTLLLLLQIKTKTYRKSAHNFGMELKN